MFIRARNCLISYPASIIKNGRQKYATQANTAVEASQEVVYPPIQDLSRPGVKRREREILSEKFKNLETVEEKLLALNMPRYYGWKLLHLQEGVVPYDSLAHAQYATRTHFVNDGTLPECYNDKVPPEKLDSMLQSVKGQIEDSILFEHYSRVRITKEEDGWDIRAADKEMGSAIVNKINSTLLTNFSTDFKHLLETQVDFDPRVEAFWFLGGIEPSQQLKKSREGIEWMKDYVDEPIENAVQYLGSPILQLRHQFPLREIVPLSESENPALKVPEFRYDPQVLGYRFVRRHATTIPGFWPGDPSEFGCLSYHNRQYLVNRPYTYKDDEEALAVQAIFASFAWLLSQACYQGFSIYNEITYPLVTQAIITNGQWWSFCVYQLNTVLLHSTHVDENPRRNICWMTKPMQLYEKVENDKVLGFDENVLKVLLKFYANSPQRREQVNIMQPYLGRSVKTIADITEDERRMWLEKTYKHIVSVRPRHRLVPEIPYWHKIYLLMYKTRPLDKKREPWEFGINVMKRRLNDHKPAYIPKCLRDDPKKKKVGRWEKTYYPNV